MPYAAGDEALPPERLPTEQRMARMRDVLRQRQLDLHVVLDNIHDPHNAGAIFRSCDAFGVGTVHLLYTEEPFPHISDGVSGYAKKWLAAERHRSAEDLAAWAQAEAVQLVATHLGEGARDYREVDWTRPSAIALGNEQRGCSPELVELAPVSVAIPMRGMAQSLNVSVAAAVILAEAARQRDAADGYEPQWDEARQELLGRWLRREDPLHRRR